MGWNFKESGFISQDRDIFPATHRDRALGLFTGPRNHLIPESKVGMPDPVPSLSSTSLLRDA